MRYPRSGYDQEGGYVYFPRMLDKIRLHTAGELPEEYHPYLGRGMDARICRFMRVAYDDVVARVKEGLDDAAVLAWCARHGRPLDEVDRMIFNDFTRKRGVDEEDTELTAELKRHKAESNLADRDDIRTFFELFEVSEGRRP